MNPKTYTLLPEELQELGEGKDTFQTWKKICDRVGCDPNTVNPTKPGQFEAVPVYADDSPQTKLKTEAEGKISQALVMPNEQLKAFESTVPKFETPREAFNHWKKVFAELQITGIDDRDGYNKVVKAIALCRTTRTTLDKMRKQEKEYYLQTGRIIDKTFNDLIELVEPIENQLNQKKDKIDLEKAEEKERKAREAQERLDKRSKQLIDLKFVFTGSAYQLSNVTVSLAEIQAIDDENWDEFVKSTAKDAYDAKVKEEAENERLRKEEEERQRKIARKASREEQLRINGFVLDDGIWEREWKSEKFKTDAGEPKDRISDSVVADCPEDFFAKAIKSAQDDVQQMIAEGEALKESMRLQQDEHDKRDRELKQREAEAKHQRLQARTAQVTALGYAYDGTAGVFAWKKGDVSCSLSAAFLDASDEVFAAELGNAKTHIEQYKKKADDAEKEKQRQEREAAEKRAKELLEQQQKEKAAAEEKERKRLEREERKKPEKQKLLEFSDKLNAMKELIPKCTEYKFLTDEIERSLEAIRVRIGEGVNL